MFRNIKDGLKLAFGTLLLAFDAHGEEAELEINAEERRHKTNLEKIINPEVEFGKNGLLVSTADDNFTLKIGTQTQLDTRTFISDEDNNASGNVFFRRARPVFEGTIFRDFGYRVLLDFNESNFRLVDSYIEYKPYRELSFRFGKYKPPFGLERLQSATDMFFIERSPASNIGPDRDAGFEIFGNIIPELEYRAGIFNGNPDLANIDSNKDNQHDFIGRLFATPFSQTDSITLKGLGVGIGATYGRHKGTENNSHLTRGYRTPGQSVFFDYADNTIADGTNWRLSPQAYYYYKNIGAMGEYYFSSQDVSRGAASETINNKAWQLATSYVLTGEDVNYRGSVVPDNDFDFNGGWGAWEIVGRLGQMDIDNDAFPVFANPFTAATKETTKGVGLNWYWSENIRLMLNYENTVFEGGGIGFTDRDNENVILTRIQLKL